MKRLCIIALSVGALWVWTPEVRGETTESVSVFEAPRPKFELVPQIAILNLNTLSLNKGSNSFNYDAAIRGVSVASVNFSIPLFVTGDFDWRGIAQLGYGTKAGNIPYDDQGNTESVRLHTIPVAALAKIRYTIPAIPSFRPALIAGLGTHFFFQSASRDEASSTYLIPSVVLGLNIGLLDPGLVSGDWFGGFNFGVTYSHGLAATNRLRTMSYDLGLVILL